MNAATFTWSRDFPEYANYQDQATQFRASRARSTLHNTIAKHRQKYDIVPMLRAQVMEFQVFSSDSNAFDDHRDQLTQATSHLYIRGGICRHMQARGPGSRT